MNTLSRRVALMSVLIAAPFLALLLAGTVIDRSLALQAASARVFELARLGSEQQREMVADTSVVLRLLAEKPDVRTMIPGVCDRMIAWIANTDRHFTRIVVARPDGTIACSSEPDIPQPNIRDRRYFNKAIASKPNVVPAVAMITSRATGRPSLVSALPLQADRPGMPPVGVIAAVLSMDWLSQLAIRVPNPVSIVALVFDPTDGDVLGAATAQDTSLSKSFPAHQIQQAFARSPVGGTTTTTDRLGTSMIFGFAPIAASEGNLLLVVGLARQEVLATANHRAWLGGGLAMIATLATVLLVWTVARILVLRPIDALVGAADRFGTGDLAARVSSQIYLEELRALGLAFNRMAARLQEHGHQLAATQAELAESEAHYRLLADNVTDMITHFGPDFRRRYISPACRDLLGYEPAELVGLEPDGIVHPDDWLLLDATLNAPLKAGQAAARATYRALHKDGHCVWLESRGRRLSGGSGYVVVTRDVSERKAFEEQLETANRQLESLATRDPLTGLANRRRFDEMLSAEHSRAQRLGLSVSVVIIDVDHFKSYNDRYGHPAGDICLQEIAGAIDSVLRRPGDLAARWGGEEFIVLFPGTDEIGAVHMAERIRAAIRNLQIEHANGNAGAVTVSVGVASAGPGAWMDQSTLIAAADQALYVAKRSGRDAVQVGPLQANRLLGEDAAAPDDVRALHRPH